MPGALRRIAVCVVAAASLAFPAVSQAMLTYVKNPLHPTVYTASGDGSDARVRVKVRNAFEPDWSR